MARSFTAAFPGRILQKSGSGRKFLLGLFALCLVLSDRTCMGAKLGSSRSYEYNGALPFSSSGDNGLNYYVHNNNHNSDENRSESRVGPLEQRLNARHAENGLEQGRTFLITIYQWNNHLGRPAKMEWTESEKDIRTCKPIPEKYEGKVRSLNTHNNCVVLYSRGGCRGAFRLFKVGSPSHNRLSDLCFHKKPMSARPCTHEEEFGSEGEPLRNSNHL